MSTQLPLDAGSEFSRSGSNGSGSAFAVLPAAAAAGLVCDNDPKFLFRVPRRWRCSTPKNPFAIEAQQQVLKWFETLGCTPAELERAGKFDAGGYVGIPFPMVSAEKTVVLAKYLSLWLLWDDVEVETLDNRWRIGAKHVLTQRRPERMSRFDEGWWQLLTGFAEARSPHWIEDLCKAMAVWNRAATEEAEWIEIHRATGLLPRFERQLELRVATIGMYATVYLLEDTYDAELPREFHAHPVVRRLKWLSNAIVGLGNDIFSFGKDYTERQINLVATLMQERGLSVHDALEHLVRMHDEALLEYDRLADSFHWPGASAGLITQWLQDVRFASLGFSLWESQAPRYAAYKVVAKGRVIEPKFSFLDDNLEHTF